MQIDSCSLGYRVCDQACVVLSSIPACIQDSLAISRRCAIANIEGGSLGCSKFQRKEPYILVPVTWFNNAFLAEAMAFEIRVCIYESDRAGPWGVVVYESLDLVVESDCKLVHLSTAVFGQWEYAVIDAE